MKQITILISNSKQTVQHDLKLHKNANYIATDKDGVIMWYENEPVTNDDSGVWITETGDDGVIINQFDLLDEDVICEDWKESLINLNE